MHTHYTQDLKKGDRVRLKTYPEIADHLSDGLNAVQKYRTPIWLYEIAGKVFTINAIEDGDIKLIGSRFGPFWVKTSAVKEKL